jgi:hypothetical protein
MKHITFALCGDATGEGGLGGCGGGGEAQYDWLSVSQWYALGCTTVVQANALACMAKRDEADG